MDLHNGLHGLCRTSPRPLQTFGSIISTKCLHIEWILNVWPPATQQSKSRKKVLFQEETDGFQGLVEGAYCWCRKQKLPYTINFGYKHPDQPFASLVYYPKVYVLFLFNLLFISRMHGPRSVTEVQPQAWTRSPGVRLNFFFCSLGKIQ